MLMKSLKQFFASCMYQSQYRELYLLLAKGLFVGNLFWLLGDLICSSTLGLTAFASEMLIFYISFLLILSVTATLLIKRMAGKVKGTLREIVHQSRVALFIQLAFSVLLMAGVSVSCLFAALSRALRSLPIIGYLFRETYDGVEPLFLVALIVAFVVAVALPLLTPFIISLSRYQPTQWYEIIESKIRPRIMGAFSVLSATYLVWLLVEALKWFLEWFFPVPGVLSALIRSVLYTLMETLVFWAALKNVLEATRAK